MIVEQDGAVEGALVDEAADEFGGAFKVPVKRFFPVAEFFVEEGVELAGREGTEVADFGVGRKWLEQSCHATWSI
jgi:hypothetical protein